MAASRTTCYCICCRLAGGRRAEVRRQFIEYDRDGDGVVSVEEAHHVLQRQLGFSVDQSVTLVRRYDRDGDGRLDYEEFVCFYAKVKTK